MGYCSATGNCIKKRNKFLLDRLNHILEKCGEEVIDGGDWTEMNLEEQLRVLLYAQTVKENYDERKAGLEVIGELHEFESDFNTLVTHVLRHRLV